MNNADAVNLFQNRCMTENLFHPLTCGGCDEREDVLSAHSEEGKVVLTCPKCDYRQVMNDAFVQIVIGMSELPSGGRSTALRPPPVANLDYHQTEILVSHSVKAIFMNEEYLSFLVEDDSFITYTVEGDCCSTSYFHDLTGVDNLLGGGYVTEVSAIDMSELPDAVSDEDHECLTFYGYRIVSHHPWWGPVTTVIGFRNESNGYYGGWMQFHDAGNYCPIVTSRVTADVLGD